MGVSTAIRSHKSAGDMRFADSFRHRNHRREDLHFRAKLGDDDDDDRAGHRPRNGSRLGDSDEKQRNSRWNSCKRLTANFQLEDDETTTTMCCSKNRSASKSVGDFLLQTSDYLSDCSNSSQHDDDDDCESEDCEKVRRHEARPEQQQQHQQQQRRRRKKAVNSRLQARKQQRRRPATSNFSLSLSSLAMLAQRQQQQQHRRSAASASEAAAAAVSPVDAEQQPRLRAKDDDVVLSIELEPEAAAAAAAQGQDRHRDNARRQPEIPDAERGSGHNNGLASVVVNVGTDSPTEHRRQAAGSDRAEQLQLQPQLQQADGGRRPPAKETATVCFCHAGQCEKCEPKRELQTAARGEREKGDTEREKRPMVDSNSGATNNTLMGAAGHYCSSWNLLNLHHSSTYKVAQRQRQQQQQQHQDRLVLYGPAAVNATPTPTTLASIVSGNTGRKQQQESGNNNNASRQQASGGGSQRNKVSLCSSRPGRSPVSLQRQTNARLARHRQRIQQQRQEQLAAHLAQQRIGIGTGTSISSNQESSFQCAVDGLHHQHDETTSGLRGGDNSMSRQQSDHLQQSANRRLANQSQLGLLLPGEAATSSGTAIAGIASTRRPNNRVQRDTTIEICDNQLPTSTSHQNSNHSHNSRGRQNGGGGGQSAGASVIVYKSINMTAYPGGSRSDVAYQPFLASSGSGGSGRSSGRYVQAERVDEINELEEGGADSGDEVKTICSSEATSSSSTLSLNRPFCKICHLGNSKNGDKLISPCRCSGTMRYIHCGCLLKWLEISNRTNEKPMSCELCAHEYTWHKRFNYNQMRLPKCSIKDAILHLVFVIAILAMIASALAPVLFKRPHSDGAPSSTSTSTTATTTDARQKPVTAGGGGGSNSDENRSRRHQHHYSTFASPSGQHHMAASAGRLASDEKFMLFCAASFFVSFFLAIYTQTKARDTLYGLMVKFFSINQTYYITEYDHEQHNNSTQTNSKQQQQHSSSSTSNDCDESTARMNNRKCTTAVKS